MRLLLRFGEDRRRQSTTMPPQLLTLRKASLDDATQIAELFQTVYGESSLRCKNPQHIRGTILEGSIRWWVAGGNGDRVIACGASIVNEWNRSWELGRTVTI